MSGQGQVFWAEANGLAVTTANDIVQLRAPSTVNAEILEVRVWQTSVTALAMNAIQFNRGTTGATGTALSVFKLDPSQGASVVTMSSLPGTSTTATNGVNNMGWNVLQEFVWLPTPEFRLVLPPSTNLGIALLNAGTYTMGAQVVWREWS